jgi:DNA-binding transcriptional regulator YiaG
MKAELLKDHIENYYCTQQHFAECFGFNPGTVRRWCSEGKYVVPEGSQVKVGYFKTYERVSE